MRKGFMGVELPFSDFVVRVRSKWPNGKPKMPRHDGTNGLPTVIGRRPSS
jgi:hypothetical protein